MNVNVMGTLDVRMSLSNGHPEVFFYGQRSAPIVHGTCCTYRRFVEHNKFATSYKQCWNLVWQRATVSFQACRCAVVYLRVGKHYRMLFASSIQLGGVDTVVCMLETSLMIAQ